MKIALDAMGGDHAPLEIVKGAVLAAEQYDKIEKIFLVGNKDILEKIPECAHDKLEIVPASEVIEMDEHPAQAYRRKKDASITVATALVKDGKADAVVSAGSTGAQLAAAMFGLGRIKGVKRPAIASFVPTLQGGKLLVDAGANTNVDVTNLVQFAQMGSVYMECMQNIASPKVGLINNGAEETKGTELTQAAYQELKVAPGINFYGNIEGRDITAGICDVMVCDGFTGNVILKTMEGMGKGIVTMLKEELMSTARTKMGAVLAKPALANLKKRMDYSDYGGAPLLGVNGVSIVCHGSSNAKAVSNGIKAAMVGAESGFVQKITDLMPQA